LLPTDDVGENSSKERQKVVWSFQEFFVREHCQMDVIDIEYQGIENAQTDSNCLGPNCE